MPPLPDNAHHATLYPTALETIPAAAPSPMTTCAPGAHTFFIVRRTQPVPLNPPGGPLAVTL